MIWSSVWGSDSGIFHQSFIHLLLCSCTVLNRHLTLFFVVNGTCVLSKQSILCGMWIYLHLQTLIYSPHPQSHPHQAKPKLFTQSSASYKWESAKCAELFSCPTVNTGQLWLRTWKESEGKKNGSEWQSTQIWTGWQDLYLMLTLSLSQIPQNSWMLCFQLKALAGV